jgi:hypothetical protein
MTSKEKALAIWVWRNATIADVTTEIRLETDPEIKLLLQYVLSQKTEK